MTNKEQQTSPKLLSSEARALAYFIQQSPEARADILAAAIADPQTSGPLIQCYRYNLTV